MTSPGRALRRQPHNPTQNQPAKETPPQTASKELTRRPAPFPPLPGRGGGSHITSWRLIESGSDPREPSFCRGPRQQAWVWDHELVSEAERRRLEPGATRQPGSLAVPGTSSVALPEAPSLGRTPGKAGWWIPWPGTLASDPVACFLSQLVSFQLLGVRSFSSLFSQISIEVELVSSFAPGGISPPPVPPPAPQLSPSLRESKHSSLIKNLSDS